MYIEDIAGKKSHNVQCKFGERIEEVRVLKNVQKMKSSNW